jgi:riboflavin synthase
VFTGIVEGIGRLERIESAAGAARLQIAAGPLSEGVALGDSMALDGCCLTVTRIEGERLAFDAVPETLQRTALGERRPGSRINLERALRADGRFGGHFVQGHVDGTGRVRELEPQGAGALLHVSCSAELAEQLVPKGSIAIDGVSLTLLEPSAQGFSIALIPHTLGATTLGERRPGDRVNLELDMIGKHVRAYLQRWRGV